MGRPVKVDDEDVDRVFAWVCCDVREAVDVCWFCCVVLVLWVLLVFVVAAVVVPADVCCDRTWLENSDTVKKAERSSERFSEGRVEAMTTVDIADNTGEEKRGWAR